MLAHKSQKRGRDRVAHSETCWRTDRKKTEINGFVTRLRSSPLTDIHNTHMQHILSHKISALRSEPAQWLRHHSLAVTGKWVAKIYLSGWSTFLTLHCQSVPSLSMKLRCRPKGMPSLKWGGWSGSPGPSWLSFRAAIKSVSATVL